MARRFTRRGLDSWFPTVARYIGLVLLVYAGFVDQGRNPALVPAGIGLALLKNVLNGGKE